MACGSCKERARALSSAASSAMRGNVRAAGQNLSFVGRTFAQDVKSGAIKNAAAARLAAMRAAIKR